MFIYLFWKTKNTKALQLVVKEEKKRIMGKLNELRSFIIF